jgi:C_GCAxxG_C_C family probable redox protein
MVEKKSFNCAERVLINANAVLQLPDLPKYLKIASGFGGGVSRRGSVCGAVSGGIMALGLRFGTDGTEPVDAFNDKRHGLRERSLTFLTTFEEEFGALDCRDLLGYELWTEAGMNLYRAARDAGLVNCDEYVAFSSKLIRNLLE